MNSNLLPIIAEFTGATGFLATLMEAAPDARVAIITADEPADGGSDAHFCAGDGPVHTLVSTMRCAVETDVWQDLDGGGTERHLDAVLGYFEEPRYSATNGAMLRPNGTLHIVIVSDSPEQSVVSVSSFFSTLDTLTSGKTSDIVIHALAFTATGEQCPGESEDPRMAQVVDSTGGVRAGFCDVGERSSFFSAVNDAVSAP